MVKQPLFEGSDVFGIIYENSPVGMVLVDMDYHVIGANKAYCDILGYSEKELQDKTLSDITHPDDWAENQVLQHKLAKGKIPFFQIQKRYTRKDGKTVWGLLVASLVRAKKGGPSFFVGQFIDITGSKQSEEAFRISEEKYKLLAETSQTGIYIHQDDKIVYANNRFAQLHGYTVDELIGTNYFDLFHPSEKKRVRGYSLKRLRGEDAPQSHENMKIKKNGEALWCQTVAVCIDYQGKPAVMGNIVDITNRKRAEDERNQFVSKLQDTLTRLETLSAISQTVNKTLDLAQVLNDTLDIVMQVFKPHSAHIRFLDEQTQEMVIIAHKGLSPEDLLMPELRKNLEDTITTYSINSGQAEAVEDLLADPRAEIKHSFTYKSGCRSLINLVLYAKNKIVGNMAIRFRETRAYTNEEIQHFTAIGYLIGTAIENARLYQDKDFTIQKLQKAHEELNRAAGELEVRVQERTEELLKANKRLKQEIEDRKRIESDLLNKSERLEEINIALNVLLEKRKEDQANLAESVLSNIKELVTPYLEMLKNTNLHDNQLPFIDILETNLLDIISPFSKRLSANFMNLTRSEIRIANLIKNGKGTKEIAKLYNLSPRTIETHRRNIRKKLGLNHTCPKTDFCE